MRIGMGAINLSAFVPGAFSVPQTPVTLSPARIIRRNGISEFVPGKFTVPQTPVVTDGSVQLRRGISAFVPANFTVPQNPVLDAQKKGMGCGCGGGCSKGMGQTDVTSEIGNVWSSLQSQDIGPFPAGYVVAGLLVAAPVLTMWMSGRKR
jgi:hypothetical protein